MRASSASRRRSCSPRATRSASAAAWTAGRPSRTEQAKRAASRRRTGYDLQTMRILITGGAGFVGSNLALAFKREHPTARVVAFDNLRRRGSETKLALLRARGVDFVHGDVRQPGDLEALPGRFDWVIDASAEPTVRAGLDGSPGYV